MNLLNQKRMGFHQDQGRDVAHLDCQPGVLLNRDFSHLRAYLCNFMARTVFTRSEDDAARD